MVNLNNLSDDRINDSLNDRINQDFSNLDNQILDKIRMNKYITIDELAKALKMSSSTINRHLKTLTTINAITRVGSKKTLMESKFLSVFTLFKSQCLVCNISKY